MADPRSIDEHRARITGALAPLPALSGPPCAGVVLAADARARLPIPPFSNSAMDGYLVNARDLAGERPVLDVVGDIPAGAAPREIPLGAAARIMTGAPTGEDHAHLRVVPVEHTDASAGPGELPARVTVLRHPDKPHIRAAGDNLGPGAVVAGAGTLVDAGAVAALISARVTEVSYHPRPKVAVISSGNELVDAGAPLGPGQLPDSNGPMISELARAAGAGAVRTVRASDAVDDFRSMLLSLAEEVDLIITTGGISAGAYDVVKETAAQFDVWFGSVAMKPGAPQGAGTVAGSPLVCLPGNPVAAFCSFHLFAAPAIRALAGHGAQHHIDLPYSQDFPRPDPRRHLLVPVRLTFSGAVGARPFNDRGVGSHLVGSLTGARGLAVIPPGHRGKTITVLLAD